MRTIQVALVAFIVAQDLLAVWLFMRLLPTRRGGRLREALGMAGFAALASLVLSRGVWIPAWVPTYLAFAGQVATYAMVLALMAAVVLFACDVSVWTAIFCGSAAYTMQNLASALGYYLDLPFSGPVTDIGLPSFYLAGAVGVAVVYALCQRLLLRRIERDGIVGQDDPGMVLIMVLVVLVAIVFDMANKSLAAGRVPFSYVLVLRGIHDVVCIFMLAMEFEMLYSRRLEEDLAQLGRMRVDAERRYRMSREGMGELSMRVHDLRHQIQSLERLGSDAEVLEQLARDADASGSRVRTGSDVLDAILTEKSLLCERDGVTLTCIADGGALWFMDEADVYSLVGNAVDNALDAVGRLRDPELRAIGLTLRRTGDMVSLSIDNNYDGRVEFADGLPQTTHPDRSVHGLGTQSIRAIAERYGGSATFSADGEVFHVDVLVPVP